MNQNELTEKWILPNRELILNDLFRLRKKVDDMLSNDAKVIAELSRWKKAYPIGLCAEIRNAMLDQLVEEMKDPETEGIKVLQNFVKAGGSIVPFWGVDKDRYFQNAIAMGTAVIDVANDTVDPYKKPIIFYPSFEKSSIKLIQSFSKVAEIDEKYWDYDVYPNIYFPELAPLFPILAIVTAYKGEEAVDAVILQQDFVDVHERNICTVKNNHVCGLAHDFIFTSAYKDKRLPEGLLAGIIPDQEATRKAFEKLHVPAGSVHVPVHLREKIKKIEQSAAAMKGILLGKRKKIDIHK